MGPKGVAFLLEPMGVDRTDRAAMDAPGQGASQVLERLFLAEELVRRRRAGEQRRHVSSQRAARIDPNPHQIRAVLFALARLPDGGCILADEVGLGKTIEAGLVIAQVLAEGARRVLVVTPKALLGQWRQELFTLFGIEAREVREGADLEGHGVFLATRDFAGGGRGAETLRTGERFDLCVVDEAHEIFAGIYRRFDRHGNARTGTSHAQMAGRFSQAIREAGTPILLLTATPIQNSLLELWGLVHYVDPTGTLLGDVATFRALFCAGDDRVLADGQGEELQRRLAAVLQRTLRREAEEFMRTPFPRRRARLLEYEMSPAERALYEDITAYLLEPGIHAFRGTQRQLLLIGFHRRMASSLRALSRSLGHVAARLARLDRGQLEASDEGAGLAEDDEEGDGEDTDAAASGRSRLDERSAADDELRARPQQGMTDGYQVTATRVADGALRARPQQGRGRGEHGIAPTAARAGSGPGLADASAAAPTAAPAVARAASGTGPADVPPEAPLPAPPDHAAVAAELARVEAFIARAEALPTDSKARALLQAVDLVFEQGRLGQGSGKVIIFTEFRATQEYLRDLLLAHGIADGDITLFRATNDSARAREALARWQDEVGRTLPAGQRPSPDIAVRLALVYELRHRSRIFISTEAGAKGLNLQFCDTVINYDLPWNPQRIEQRIGRCHRYAQPRDVTVINFLASDNEAQRLTYDILSRKLELFGTVLGATDEVLHEPGEIAPEVLAGAVGGELEAQLRRIYDRARTVEEVERELRELRDAIEARRRDFEEAQRRTAAVIERRFDATVKQVFRRLQEELPRELAEFDRQIERVVVGFLEAAEIPYAIEREGTAAVLAVGASARLPEPLREGTRCAIGEQPAGAALASLHLGHPLVAAALAEIREAAAARRFALRIHSDPEAPEAAALRGRRGRARVYRAAFPGFEVTERLVPVVVLDPAEGPLAPELARTLLEGRVVELPAGLAAAHVTDGALDDARDELLFLETAETGGGEQARFESALAQIDRAVADRVLVLGRQRAAASERSLRAEGERAAAVGPEPRERAERVLRAAEAEIEVIDREIDRLEAGDDDDYRRWRGHARERRYARPELQLIFDAEIEIA